MKKIRGQIEISRPVEDVFDFVADETNEPRYNDDMVRCEKVTSGPIGVGTRYEAAMKSTGSAAMTVEVTGYDRPRRLESRAHIEGFMDIRGVMSFEEAPGGTLAYPEPRPECTLGVTSDCDEYTLNVDIDKGLTRTPEFLKRNPNGRIPTLELDDGTHLPESNAILWYLAEGSRFVPPTQLGRAQVLQWMFFEQYSHEPYVAVPRFWLTKGIDVDPETLAERQRVGYTGTVRELRSVAQPVKIDYSMRKTEQGWKIYDIVVEGVSLVLTYRSEFDAVVKQEGVDGLIKRLGQKNTPAAVGGSK